jgi:hypothetical protein
MKKVIKRGRREEIRSSEEMNAKGVSINELYQLKRAFEQLKKDKWLIHRPKEK